MFRGAGPPASLSLLTPHPLICINFEVGQTKWTHLFRIRSKPIIDLKQLCKNNGLTFPSASDGRQFSRDGKAIIIILASWTRIKIKVQ